VTTWKVAPSLDRLYAQLHELAPRRSKESDGSIGNTEHASRTSDHNPWWVHGGQSYVTARDFTHDPRGGLSCEWLAEQLRRGRDPRVKYVIWDQCIMAGASGPSPWTWRPYIGANPHECHLHLSVVADARALARTPWQLAPLEDDDMSAETERLIREIHDEVTGRLDNRRGPLGAEIPNGGDETLLGYAANADGFGFRIEQQLDEVIALLRRLGQ
jgi:hypothetical protein